MAEEKKKPKTAIVAFMQSLEKMEMSAQPSKLSSETVKSSDSSTQNVESQPQNSFPRRKVFRTPVMPESFMLPSGKSCDFITKNVDSKNCCVWHGNARDQDRMNLDDLSSLKASIQAQGQLVPALVRRAGKKDNPNITHEVIYGSRRLKACQELGVQLKVLEAEISDEDAVFFMDAENASREDLSLYEKAKIYSKWLHDGVFTSKTELARSLGISERWVRQLLSFLKIPKELILALPSLKDLTSPRAEKIIFYLSKFNDAELKIQNSIENIRKEKPSYTSDDLFNRIFKDISNKQKQDDAIQAWETKELVADDGEKVVSIKTTKTGKISIEVNRSLSPQRLSRFLDGLDKLAKKL
jgi:ParB/RepB/Spo0J family partition protein